MNDDLISRKAVFELIDSKGVNGALMCGEKLMIDAYGLMDEVSDLPTAYDVDKVVEQLEENADVSIAHHFSVEKNVAIRTKEAIEIVKAGGTDE